MLKKLNSDRRVDRGAKWSPVFGRYSFLAPDCDGQVISVGDEVVVSKRLEETTKFGKSIRDRVYQTLLTSVQIGPGCVPNRNALSSLVTSGYTELRRSRAPKRIPQHPSSPYLSLSCHSKL